MLSKNQIKSIIESMLFISEYPVTIDKFAEVIEESERNEIRDALYELKEDLIASERGIRLDEIGGGFQLRTTPSNSSWIFRMNKLKPAKLSRASIETLSIIAYRQPLTKQEVESIRGVDSGWTIKTLLERNLIKIIGKKEEPGNPLIYSTTKHFLEFFNLSSLDELPTLRDYHELSQEQGCEFREPELEFSNDTPSDGAESNQVEESSAQPNEGPPISETNSEIEDKAPGQIDTVETNEEESKEPVFNEPEEKPMDS